MAEIELMTEIRADIHLYGSTESYVFSADEGGRPSLQELGQIIDDEWGMRPVLSLRDTMKQYRANCKTLWKSPTDGLYVIHVIADTHDIYICPVDTWQ